MRVGACPPAPRSPYPTSTCMVNAPSVLQYVTASASSLCSLQADKQQQPARRPTPAIKPSATPSVTILPSPVTYASVVSSLSSLPAQTPASPTTPNNDGYTTPKSKLDKENQIPIQQLQEIPSPSPMSSTGKRKRLDMDDELTSFITPTPSKRKASSDFLRKGQWTSTEERLARLLIEAFEEGYLPIYTGIRLRGYLAVQLQCDPMRVSKKLCAGAIDGKQVPKNYGQKKFKLRKKNLWDSDEAACRIVELEKLTKAMWSEARMRKPSFLTLSSTRNLKKRRGSDEDDDSMSSPPSPARGRIPSSTPRLKKQKVFPIIYLNLSKLKRYSGSGDSSDSDLAAPSKDSDSDSDPVRLDGESLQAAYDLLTLCSPRGTSTKGKAKRGKLKKDTLKQKADKTLDKTADGGKSSTVGSNEDKFSMGNVIDGISVKEEPTEIPGQDKYNEGKSSKDPSSQDTASEPINDASIADSPGENAFTKETTVEDTTMEDAFIKGSSSEDLSTRDTLIEDNSNPDDSIKSESSFSTPSA